MKKILLKLKELYMKMFNNEKRGLMFEFPNVKVKILEDKIDVTKNAQTDGKLNEPKSNSKNLSVTENEAFVAADEFRASQVNKATLVLKTLEERIRENQSKLDQDNFHVAQFKNEINDQLINAEGKLSNLKDIYDKEDQQVRNFKRENHLTRDPLTLNGLKILIGISIVTILFIIEVWVNSNLVAEAMMTGKAGGRAIATAVAALNVFVSFAVGYFALKNMHHISNFKKTTSSIIFTIYLIFIFYINWALGAFRAIYEKTGKTGLQVLQGDVDVITGVPHLPWTVEFSFYGIILTFIGIGFAIASLLDGYFFNDRYPGFGSVAKLREETKKEINRLRERLSPEINIKFKNEIKKTNEKKQQIIENILRKEWTPSATALQNIFDSYKRFISDLNGALKHSVEEYRRVNETYRSSESPEYFQSDLGKKLSENHSKPELVFAGYSELYLGKNEIEKKMSIYLDKIEDEGDNYIELINTYHENEINKKIEDIRNNYKAENV